MHIIAVMMLAASAIGVTPAAAQTGSQHDHSQSQPTQSSPASPTSAHEPGQQQPGTICQCPMMQRPGTMQQGQAMQHQMRNTTANPFAEGEMRMHQRMMTATGDTPDGTWVRKMIEHHRGAVEAARTLIATGRDQDALRIARETIASQEREIAELQAWLQRHNEQPQ